MARGFSYIQMRFSNLGILLAIACLSGCGTATYEAQYTEALTEYRKETPFVSLWSTPAEIPEAGLNLRLPKLFIPENSQTLPGYPQLAEKPGEDIDSYLARLALLLPPDPRNKAVPIDPYRLQPDFLKLPGHVRTYECFLQVQQPGKPTVTTSLYLYAAVEPKQTRRGKSIAADELKDDIKKSLVKKFGKRRATESVPPAPTRQTVPVKGCGEWETVQLPDLEGGTITWERIHAVGDQIFHRYSADTPTLAEMKYTPDDDPGEYLIYFHSAPDRYVILGWRARSRVFQQHGINPLAEAVAGTITLGEEKAAPKAPVSLEGLE